MISSVATTVTTRQGVGQHKRKIFGVGEGMERGCVCIFIKLHITAQSGPVILVILCHSH